MPQTIITRLFLEIKKHEFQVTMLGIVDSTDLQYTVSETSPPNIIIIDKKSYTCNPKKLAAANRQKRCSWKPRNTSFRLQRRRLRRRESHRRDFYQKFSVPIRKHGIPTQTFCYNFRILKHQRRRAVIVALRDMPQPVITTLFLEIQKHKFQATESTDLASRHGL